MATVTPVHTGSGLTLYEVEKSSWASPSVLTFDSRHSVPLSDSTQLDILLLADGLLAGDQSTFERHVSDWYDNTFATTPFHEFRAAFRVQAVFTPSANPSSAAGDSYFGAIVDGGQVDSGSRTSARVRERLFDVLAFVKAHSALNTRTYPDDLVIGRSGDRPREASTTSTPREADIYQRLMRNCVVSIAVHDGHRMVSGFFGNVRAPEGHELGSDTKLSVAFGKGFKHEFSHAFGLMLDEYIDGRGEFSRLRHNPSHRSVFEMWNLTYTGRGDQAPWVHLSPIGHHPRPSSSRVGQLWVGGKGRGASGGEEGKELGVWHSEYTCQMNGRHKNYFVRTDEPDRIDGSGDRVFSGLRMDEFCFWCEEILVVKILEKTDAFLAFDDVFASGGDVNELGRIWYRRWERELRDRYWADFDIRARIDARELYYRTPANLAQLPHFSGDISTTDLMTAIVPHQKGQRSILL